MSFLPSPLELEAASGESTFALGAPIHLDVTLRNAGPSSVWVNRRMGVGYEDSLERELFFSVYATDGTVLPVPDEVRADVHRLPPQVDDFELLSPGASVSTVVDVAMWQPLRETGRYRIVFTYENHWDGSAFGFDAVTGRLTSPGVTITLR